MPIRTQIRYPAMRLEEEIICDYCSIPKLYAEHMPCGHGQVLRRKQRKAGEKKETRRSDGAHSWVSSGEMVPVPVLSGPKEFKINPLRRLVGLEVEVNDYVDGEAVSRYAEKIGAGICADCAYELNTPPANGDAMVKMLVELSDEIRKAGSVAKNGSGLHTHVDCRDLTYNDIRKVCVLYGKTELALYSIIDPRRCTANSSRGGFCKMVGGKAFAEMFSDPSTAKEDFIRFVYGSEENLKKWRPGNKAPPGGERYLGINLHSWTMRGTIEFRLHHGTTKSSKMIPWAMLMGGMVQTAASKGDSEIAAWPVGKEGMKAYAPTDMVRQWIDERWDYFASKRKNKAQPIFIDAPQPQSIGDPVSPDYDD